MLQRLLATSTLGTLFILMCAEAVSADGPIARIKGGPRIVTVNQEIVLQPAEDVKVRVQKLPLQFDDKGKPKPYTAEELKTLKGPEPSAPGYTAEYSDLKQGQTVRAYLGRKIAAADKDKAEAKDAEIKWSPAGQLTGRLVQVDNRAPTKGPKKKNVESPKKKRFDGPASGLVLRVESMALTPRGLKARTPDKGDGKHTLDEDLFVTMIVVLQDGPQQAK